MHIFSVYIYIYILLSIYLFMLEKWKKGGFVSFISTIVQLVLTMSL